MSMRTDDFDYNLPEELIAQAPAEPRDSCRLLVVGKSLVEPRFLAFAQEAAADGGIGVPLVAIDEAHCVSQWGQDFRPAYLQIREFIDSLPQRPIVAAFTATATERVRADIQQVVGHIAMIGQVGGHRRHKDAVLDLGCTDLDRAKEHRVGRGLHTGFLSFEPLGGSC